MKLATAIVTGATGYLGSQLVRSLLAQQVRVGIIVRKTSDLYLLEGIKDKITIFTDNNDFEKLKDFLIEFKTDVIFHLASKFLVEHKPEDIPELIQTNITFSTQLLEAMLAANTTRIVNTGTAWQHYRQEQYCPTNLYAATKQAFYDVLRYYVDAHDFKAINLELFDTYGPGDPRKKLIQLLLQQINKKTPLDMSKGEQEIDLVHVDDVVSAYICAGELLLNTNQASLETYSVASGHPIKLSSIIELVSELSGNELAINLGRREYRKREVLKLPKIHGTLPGWKANIDLRAGLKLLIVPDHSH